MATILVQIIVSCSVLPENDTLLLWKRGSKLRPGMASFLSSYLVGTMRP